MANPRGGSIGVNVDFSDETELANILLSCIADNEQYLVINQKIKNWYFIWLKQK